jgi:hypothetical protein
MQTAMKTEQTRRRVKLKIEYRQNGDVVVICRSRVIARTKSTADANLFIEGFREAEVARAV